MLIFLWVRLLNASLAKFADTLPPWPLPLTPIYAVWRYMTTMDSFFPVTDGMMPIIGAWFVLLGVVMLWKTVIMVANFVRGSGA